ncbi:MAG: carboxypeptidase regulatory-like domain-containing protein [Terracidiphilus sp.]
MGLLIAALLLWQPPAFAQETTGAVSGVVQDKTGAVIPGASVVVTNLDNNSERKTESNSTGEFSVPGITAGLRYQVRVEMPGFSTWQSQPFPLRPGDRISFTDIRMQLETATASVTVEASDNQTIKPLDTPERSDVITSKDLDTLALVGRDATELIGMLPGFALVSNQVNNQGPNTAVVGMSGPTGSYSANGAGPTGLATILDGVSIQDIANNSGTVQQVNQEMIQDIKATTSTFSAEYAKGPAVLNANTKAGGTSYHGDAYMYYRNTVLNSNDWYNNYLQQTRPPGTYYYPGGQLGGPLWIPRTRFGPHNTKLFFFFGYEYYNQSFSPETLGSWVPTMAERQGDFSQQSLNSELCGARPDGNQNLNAVQPLCNAENYLPSGPAVANGNVAQFANSSGAALVNWLPLPNADPFVNQEGFNYIQQVVQTQNGSILHARVDFNLSDYNKFYATYGRQAQISDEPVAFGYVPFWSMEYPGDVTSGDVSNIFSLHYTRIFGASVTNSASASMSFISNPGNMGNPQAASRFYMNDYNCSNAAVRAAAKCGTPGNPPGNGNFNYLGEYKNSNGGNGDYSVPALSDYGDLGYPNMLMAGGFYNNQIRMKKLVPTFSDTVNWIKGQHSFSFGAYVERGYLNGDADYASAFPQGEYTFNPGNGAYEFNNNPGQPFANAADVGCESPDPAGTSRLSGAADFGSCINPVAMMYTGYADSFNQTNFSPVVDMQYTSLAGFANDAWKLHRMTLVVGARIEHLGPWFDRHGNGLATFSPSLYASECSNDDYLSTGPAIARNCNSLALPGITWHGANSSVANSVSNPPTVYFSPRVGASIDIFGKGKTVVRGGWGIYRNQEAFNAYALAGATAQGYKTSNSVGLETFGLIEDQSPINPPDIDVETLSPSDNVRPIYYQFNVSFDQKMPWNSLLEVAFVGSESRNLPTYNAGGLTEGSAPGVTNAGVNGYNGASDLNVIPLGTFFGSTFAPGEIPPSVSVGCSAPNPTLGNLCTAQTDFFRKYPFYQHIYSLSHDFYANYNSAQVSWNKSTGMVSWGANFTFSKDLATAASYSNALADPLNLRNDYNPATFDRSQVFNVHHLVNLGQRYKHGNHLLSAVSNGWMISGIFTWQSGPDLPSEQGENFGFGSGTLQVIPVSLQEQAGVSVQTCENTYNIPSPGYCVANINSVIWMGSPDYELMPNVTGNPKANLGKHQFINPTAFGVPLPGSPTTGPYATSKNPTGQGQYRLPYLHGPAYWKYDLSLFKGFKIGEGKNVELRASAFNVFNHPLVSFNNDDPSNLELGNLLGAVPGQSLTTSQLGYKDFGIANIKYGSRLLELSGKFTF